ncbi:MAG: hypothetical protein AVDCRST_MAG77-4725 [uncultured Chloroflexi bacterium]|uniref:Methyltransferase type 11 domain-containing protein n=1 Tax=uncultured Chloroflexota bacterium TaxID=166587 RepID=A0A6J4JYY0_9CHLR|nr:MAG: hypothetical protein AVDCRST_MAG77-4725 [uncultured Chloroflexota bacterium]
MWLGRWPRARRWLSRTRLSGGRILDVGCAIGFGTSELARARGAYRAFGVEPHWTYVKQARASYPDLAFIRGSAADLPIAGASINAVALLDVLEHLARPEAAIAEARRVLRPGGALVISVPNQGWLEAFDSLNVYGALRRFWPSLAPLDPSETSGWGAHRHFSVTQVRALLGDEFKIERIAITGVGLSEPLHLAILLFSRVLLRSERAYSALRYIYYTAYLLEDALPLPVGGYHLTVLARARASATAGPLRAQV